MSIDKIGYEVYNVHRNPLGSIYTYIGGKYTYPLGVFQGILSEYLALKCSPIVVYIDFRDFLVTGYVCIWGVAVSPACPFGKSRVIAKIKINFLHKMLSP